MNAVRHTVSNSVCNTVTHAERNDVRRRVQNQNQNQTLISCGFLLCGYDHIQSNGDLGALAAPIGFGAKR